MVKRKRSALNPDEDSVSKRQLRSSLAVSSSTPSRSTRSSAKQVASPSKGNPHGPLAKDDTGDTDEDSADELALQPQTQSPSTPCTGARVTRTYGRKDRLQYKNQKLTDETDFPCADPVGTLDSDDEPLTMKRRTRRGKPAPQGAEDVSVPITEPGNASRLVRNHPLQSPRKRTTRSVAVEVTIPITLKKANAQSPSPHPPDTSPSNAHPLLSEPVTPDIVLERTSDRNNIDFFSEADTLHRDLHGHLNEQKKQTLLSLQRTSSKPRGHGEEGPSSVNDSAAAQLSELINGTVMRAEGNSCLLLGPRSSGKSRILESCLHTLPMKPILLRLSGWIQTTDRHALREIAVQLLQQTGSSILPGSESVPEPQTNVEEEENPFLDPIDDATKIVEDQNFRLPPSSHLHALIPILLTLNRPVIVILDAFDLFALHPRQSLLYCLLDNVQNSRASSESRGIAVIGMTSRLDTVQLLEKRVKSRFSGRTIRTSPPNGFQDWMDTMRRALRPFLSGNSEKSDEEWGHWWGAKVEEFLTDPEVVNLLNETFSITREPKLMERLLRTPILRLNPSEPHLTFKSLCISAETQRARPSNLLFTNLSYPAMCLLIASVHADTSGHPIFTFEMLFDYFRDQLRASTAAPVQVNGGNIGMVRCTREVLMATFDGLIASKTFVCVTGPSSNISKEFMKYRSNLHRSIVKPIIDKSGQIHLKKWLTKAQ
ncbi:unnamed protein product [Cyclocybe aegerita]|uniref:Origin recognition complex subunit 4 n=1 Tax=Cyclocybe aegerita TaxID=1973307 RepID=A0A8S0WKR8_CYCAE|nr:unnamed protein product [Cyclocybe aegerita]